MGHKVIIYHHRTSSEPLRYRIAPLNITGPDRPGKSIDRIIDQSNGFIITRHGHHSHHRAKNFLPHNGHIGFYIVQDKGREIESRTIHITRGAAGSNPGTRIQTGLDLTANLLLLLAASHTPHVTVPLGLITDKRRANSQSLHSACQNCKEFIVYRLMNEETLCSAAGLSRISQTRPHKPCSSPFQVRIGAESTVVSQDARGLARADVKAVKTKVEGELKAALAAAGYPEKADPARINLAGAFGVMLLFVIAATAVYGPLAAALVELFPTRIRYTAMSLPYHIGTGWIGGFVPFTAFAIVAATGDIYSGLWYPLAFTVISVVTCVLFLPETRGRSLDI